MINIDIFERGVPGGELKQQAFQNQSQGVMQDQERQAQQRLRNMVKQERDRVHNENQQTS